jgi:hypothetical protein
MKTFTDHELRLIRKVAALDTLAVVELKEACPRHSACVPLPLFGVQKVSDDEFEAVWNDHHVGGPRQRFRFAEVAGLEPAS